MALWSNSGRLGFRSIYGIFLLTILCSRAVSQDPGQLLASTPTDSPLEADASSETTGQTEETTISGSTELPGTPTTGMVSGSSPSPPTTHCPPPPGCPFDGGAFVGGMFFGAALVVGGYLLYLFLWGRRRNYHRTY